MERSVYKELSSWKQSLNRKPLIISGARQVGKTWVMKKFAQQEYEKYIYFNFENNTHIKNIFSEEVDIPQIILALEVECGERIDAANTLLIFDEIQEVPKALMALKYFYENAPQYHILASSSYHGVAMQQKISIPVESVTFLNLLPLTFIEFLKALGENNLANLIENSDWDLITSNKQKYLYFLRQYFIVGGMPEVVTCFKELKDFAEVRKIQTKILLACEQDFFKNAPIKILSRIRQIWNAVPLQLAQKNKKFKYGNLKQGARAKEYEQSIQWLIDTGLVMQVCRVNKPAQPLMAYEDVNTFKLYPADIGLMAAIMNIDIRTQFEENALFEVFNGAFRDQYVLQQMKASKDIKVCYWASETSNAEIDFLLQFQTLIVPLEVNAIENLQAKNLKFYHQKYHPLTTLRTSLSNYRSDDKLCNIPLYAIGNLSQILSDKFANVN